MACIQELLIVRHVVRWAFVMSPEYLVPGHRRDKIGGSNKLGSVGGGVARRLTIARFATRVPAWSVAKLMAHIVSGLARDIMRVSG